MMGDGDPVELQRTNADLIVHAVNSLPTLIAALRAEGRRGDELAEDLARAYPRLVSERDAACARADEAEAERDRAVRQRDKTLSDLDRASGALSGMHERFAFESHKWLGVSAHLQAHCDHLVEVNASLRSQVAEAGLCRELIAERDALRAEVECARAELITLRGANDNIAASLRAARDVLPADQHVPLVDRIRAVVEERDRLAARVHAAEITFKGLAAGRISHQRACYRANVVLGFDLPGISDDDAPIGGVVVEEGDE
jgi:hypothetical protein